MGFRKAEPKQMALKMAIYGAPGSGKTFTSLLFAEGLTQGTGKRIAYLDTERGTDFYAKTVEARKLHPEAFDFDALYTQSLSETLKAIQELDTKEYNVVVIDSITHLWEAAKNAYSGKRGPGGQIPMPAWGSIKRPYKLMMSLLMSSPMHVFICGRQGIDMGEDDNGEMKVLGYKMKAEGETAYEPHILIRMESVKQKKGPAIIQAFAEKDRSGVLAGKMFHNPNFDMIIKPLLPLLDATKGQAKIQDVDETSTQDAEAGAEDDLAREAKSLEFREKFEAMIKLSESDEDLENVNKEITPAVKKQMLTEDVATLRIAYLEKSRALKPKV